MSEFSKKETEEKRKPKERRDYEDRMLWIQVRKFVNKSKMLDKSQCQFPILSQIQAMLHIMISALPRVFPELSWFSRPDPVVGFLLSAYHSERWCYVLDNVPPFLHWSGRTGHSLSHPLLDNPICVMESETMVILSWLILATWGVIQDFRPRKCIVIWICA